MNLSQPVKVSIRNKEYTFNSLDVTIIDKSSKKTVQVYIHPFRKLLTLWEKEAYDAAGDYTQAQVESKILELLGNNPASTLSSLIQ
jgi:hypothetical protein